ncbi:MAG TPA: hypothetical protein VFO18_05545 [Methylomirabilota bacterium]|nr:hypothetical protein [Methylomirabilota bacterium]
MDAPSLGRRLTPPLTLLLFAALWSGCVIRSVNQPAGACREPQPLCGEWAGAWDSNAERGEAYLSVTRVSGREVEGLVLLRGRFPEQGKDLPFTGTFENNELVGTILTSSGSPPIQWQVRLDAAGTALKGRGFDGAWTDLYLTKRR